MSSNISTIRAQRVKIDGGTFNIDNRTTQFISTLPHGMKTLIESERISRDCLHNSKARMKETNEMEVTHAVKGWDSFLAHKPQPTTSFDQFGVDDAINAIFSWVSDSSTPLLIMWVHDDNKTKTSFIAQVVAQLLEKRGRLSASYFFNENTDADSVVPTLVYDLVMQDHDDGLLRDEVSRVIDRYSGKVFDSTCREQFNRLLVAPVEAVSKLYRGQSHRPLQGDLILLHAFEDCNDEFGFHETFLSALLQALLTIKETLFSQRLLIIGRRTNRLEKFLTIGQPILQRPVQSRHWLKGEKNISQEIVESTRRVDKMRRSFTELNLALPAKMSTKTLPELPKIEDTDLLIEVFTHRSLRQTPEIAPCKVERLAEMGSHILNTVVTSYYFKNRPLMGAEIIKTRRDHWTSPEMLNTWLDLYRMKEKLCVPPNEGDRICNDLLQMKTYFHAFVGALYVSKGQHPIEEWISELINRDEEVGSPTQPLDAEPRDHQDFVNSVAFTPESIVSMIQSQVEKSEEQLQVEPSLERQGNEPTSLASGTSSPVNIVSMLYEAASKRHLSIEFIPSSEGPSHKPIWTVKCRIANVETGIGVGKSRKVAREDAARRALEAMGW